MKSQKGVLATLKDFGVFCNYKSYKIKKYAIIRHILSYYIEYPDIVKNNNLIEFWKSSKDFI